MSRFVTRRLLLALPVLLGVSIVSFLIIYLSPGDPAELIIGTSSDARDIDQVREELGLNKPLWVQYGLFLKSIGSGLGTSNWTKRPVAAMIAERLPTTLMLAALSVFLMLAMAIPAGVIAAVRRQSNADYLVMALAVVGNSTPTFWLALLLMWLFAGYLGVLPASGTASIQAGLWEYLKHFLMPAFTLAFWMGALVARLTRSAMLEVLGEDYIRTARAKGASPRTVTYRHAFRNAMLPVLTVIGLNMGALLGGSVITETVFALPGVGRLVVQAILVKDFAVVQGVLLVVALMLVLLNLLVDLSYAFLDPRIRYA